MAMLIGRRYKLDGETIYAPQIQRRLSDGKLMVRYRPYGPSPYPWRKMDIEEFYRRTTDIKRVDLATDGRYGETR